MNKKKHHKRGHRGLNTSKSLWKEDVIKIPLPYPSSILIITRSIFSGLKCQWVNGIIVSCCIVWSIALHRQVIHHVTHHWSRDLSSNDVDLHDRAVYIWSEFINGRHRSNDILWYSVPEVRNSIPVLGYCNYPDSKMYWWYFGYGNCLGMHEKELIEFNGIVLLVFHRLDYVNNFFLFLNKLYFEIII